MLSSRLRTDARVDHPQIEPTCVPKTNDVTQRVNDHGRGVAHRTEYRPCSTNTTREVFNPHPAELKNPPSTTLSKLYDKVENL